MKKTTEQLKKKELFDVVIRLMDREDHLVNSRMTWYLTIQGFTIAAVALILTGKLENDMHLQKQAIILLSCLGIAISLVVFISVRRARNAKKNVRAKWKQYVPKYPDKDGFFLDPSGDVSWLSIFTPGQSIPVILIVFWLAVIFKGGQSAVWCGVWILVISILNIINFFIKRKSNQSDAEQPQHLTSI